MDHVSIDAAAALSGEEAFILQLRPPTPPGVDEAALAVHVDRFTSLYLTGAGPERARFAKLAPLTWAVAASRFDAGQVEAMRADLCETLFGADHPERAQLARQPGEPQEDTMAGQPSAAARAAFDDDSDTFDIEAAVLDLDDSDVFEVDSWRLSERGAGSDPAPAQDLDMDGPPAGDFAGDMSGDTGENFDETRHDDSGLDASWDDGAPADDAPELDDHDEPGLQTDVEDDVLGALAQLERAFAGNGAATDDEPESFDEGDAAPDSVTLDDAPVWDVTSSEPIDVSTHEPSADEPFDAGRFESDLDAFEEAAQRANAPDPLDDAFGVADGLNLVDDPFGDADDLWKPAVSAAQDADRFESLTEAPAPRNADLASELAAFRQEMRAIAGAIPGAGTGDALDHFRSELDAIAGSMGQRIDGAAQRIEAAAERIVSAAGPETADRFDGAADRAERSAALMEASVQDAVRALKAVLEVAADPGRDAVAGL